VTMQLPTGQLQLDYCPQTTANRISAKRRTG